MPCGTHTANAATITAELIGVVVADDDMTAATTNESVCGLLLRTPDQTAGSLLLSLCTWRRGSTVETPLSGRAILDSEA